MLGPAWMSSRGRGAPQRSHLASCCQGHSDVYLHRRRRRAAAGSPQSKSRRPPPLRLGTAAYRAHRLEPEQKCARGQMHTKRLLVFQLCLDWAGGNGLRMDWHRQAGSLPEPHHSPYSTPPFPGETPRAWLWAPLGCCFRSWPPRLTNWAACRAVSAGCRGLEGARPRRKYRGHPV